MRKYAASPSHSWMIRSRSPSPWPARKNRFAIRLTPRPHPSSTMIEDNYQDYEADRRKRLGAEAEQPHRIKDRKLVGG